MVKHFPHRAAQKIAAHRRNCSMSKEQFGGSFAVKRTQVWRWENGAQAPSSKTMQMLALAGICEPNDWFAPADLAPAESAAA
jgi:DNA-binding transcriptional regulator YiaG